MKEGTPQLAKCNREFALKASEHILWPVHCRPEEEVNGAQERLTQAVWVKDHFRDCCQSEYRRIVFGIATWAHIESRVTLFVRLGIPGHMLEQTIVDIHDGCPNSTPNEQRDLGLTVADEKQRTLGVPQRLLFHAFSYVFSLKIFIPAWPRAVLGFKRLVGKAGFRFQRFLDQRKKAHHQSRSLEGRVQLGPLILGWLVDAFEYHTTDELPRFQHGSCPVMTWRRAATTCGARM